MLLQHSTPLDNINNLKLLAKHNDFTNTMKTVSERFQEFKKYAVHQDNLQSESFLAFLELTASPKVSIQNLMNRLHLAIFGSDELRSNTFEMLVSSYGVGNI